jgi:hypothetical protein
MIIVNACRGCLPLGFDMQSHTNYRSDMEGRRLERHWMPVGSSDLADKACVERYESALGLGLSRDE